MWNLIQASDDFPDDHDGSVRLDVVEGVTGPRAKEETEMPVLVRFSSQTKDILPLVTRRNRLSGAIVRITLTWFLGQSRALGRFAREGDVLRVPRDRGKVGSSSMATSASAFDPVDLMRMGHPVMFRNASRTPAASPCARRFWLSSLSSSCAPVLAELVTSAFASPMTSDGCSQRRQRQQQQQQRHLVPCPSRASGMDPRRVSFDGTRRLAVRFEAALLFAPSALSLAFGPARVYRSVQPGWGCQ